MDIDCTLAKRRRLNLIGDELPVETPGWLYTGEVPDIGYDITSSRIRPDLTDALKPAKPMDCSSIRTHVVLLADNKKTGSQVEPVVEDRTGMAQGRDRKETGR
jgi:hypothetical protein